MQKTPYKNPKKILAQIWRTLKRKISATCCFTTRYADFGGERGKPDLILPKYVRNDITLSM